MTPKHQNYRVCYDGRFEDGKFIKGDKLYSLYKYCDCSDCKSRMVMKREPRNWVSATTKDVSMVDRVAEILKDWTCGGSSFSHTPTFLKF